MYSRTYCTMYLFLLFCVLFVFCALLLCTEASRVLLNYVVSRMYPLPLHPPPPCPPSFLSHSLSLSTSLSLSLSFYLPLSISLALSFSLSLSFSLPRTPPFRTPPRNKDVSNRAFETHSTHLHILHIVDVSNARFDTFLLRGEQNKVWN